MGHISLLIDTYYCCGCHTCEVACKQEHGLGIGPRLIRIFEKGPYFIPVYCHHCANAPCIEACPVDALYTNEQGIVLTNKELCIGCKACMEACPFGAMQFDEENETAIKCDLCIERLNNQEQPACSKACPTQCIYWGDITELSNMIQEKKAVNA
jgi:Fe-S-cluster-containing dehydrogenase component